MDRRQGVEPAAAVAAGAVGVVFPAVTRFGAPARPVESAGGVLRAVAASCGVRLVPVGAVDLLASAVAADAWCVLVRRNGFDGLHLLTDAPRAVLAAALTRSAGHAPAGWEVPVTECASSARLLRLAEQHRAWAVELCPDAAGVVLARAGSDLAAGGPRSVFLAYGALLQLLASEFTAS